MCISIFIHIYIAPLQVHYTTQKRSRPQQLTLCRSLNAEALQAIANEGLAQGPRVATRAGFEPTILRSKIIFSTKLMRHHAHK